MSRITLCTLNARYIHCSLGLRYLLANMGELEAQTELREFTIDQRPIDIAEQLLADKPSIIGFGIYIWNIEQTTQLIALLKTISPETLIVIGGPEVSFEQEQQAVCSYADYVVCGAADKSFAQLCRKLLAGEQPQEKVIPSPFVAPTELVMPYAYYSDDDIAHRVIYVEASRGCPFKCEFCLSSLDKTAWPFDLDAFLEQMQSLHDRGVRHFKFVDRTFNLKIANSMRILEFFLERMTDDLFLHFELIPDHLPEALKALIRQFPANQLQFEIGIQSFTTEVQQLISRKQDNNKSKENLHWIRHNSHAHIHSDLIIGLPGEDYHSFANSFDQLVALGPHEIQVGILKRLRGTPIIRHSISRDMRYNPSPPYNILSTDRIDFNTMQRLSRFSRYWDMIANSGRFAKTLPLILADNPFKRFMRLSDWLYTNTRQTHKISLKRLFDLLYLGLHDSLDIDRQTLIDSLLIDYRHSGQKGLPGFARGKLNSPPPREYNAKFATRQKQHRN